MKILGISAFYHDSAAVILQDGEIIAAAQEERFSRIKHDPGFVLLEGWKMLLHTFRGSSIRSALGLESEKKVFERYRAIRRAEREYV